MSDTAANSRTCLNCDQPLRGRYCADCGQDNGRPRLTIGSVLSDACDVIFNLETPLLYTAINLTWRPGWVAGEYVRGRRRTFTNPMKYCLLMAALDVLLLKWLGFDVQAIMGVTSASYPEDSEIARAMEAGARVTTFFIEWMAAFTFITLPILAGMMRLLFWKAGRNIVEQYVLCLYVYGHSMLLQASMVPLGAYEEPLSAQLMNLIPVVYLALATVQFLPGRWWVSVLKSLVAHLVYFMAVLAIGTVAAMVYYIIAMRGAEAAG